MIERLNFYDLYGYLLPGLAWLGLMWLPVGLVWERWPGAELSSAVAALVVGYLAGHLLQGLAMSALPSKRRDQRGERREPSDILLDDPDTLSKKDIAKCLAPEVKRRVVSKILLRFGMDVTDQPLRDAKGLDPAEVKKLYQALHKRRQDVFFLCRRALIQKDVASYAEQFEGMYALMRGVAAASILSAAYHLGWAASRFLPGDLKASLSYIASAWLILAILGCKTRSAFLLTAFFLATLGAILGSETVISERESFILLLTGLASLFSFFRFHEGYVAFAWNFAATVYRDFSAL